MVAYNPCNFNIYGIIHHYKVSINVAIYLDINHPDKGVN